MPLGPDSFLVSAGHSYEPGKRTPVLSKITLETPSGKFNLISGFLQSGFHLLIE